MLAQQEHSLKEDGAKMESIFPGHTSAYEYNHKRHNFSSFVIFLKNFHASPQQLANNFFPKI